jgi:hypothetical protein
MNESEPSEVMATDRNPAVEITAASASAEPGAAQRKGGKGCLIAAGVVLGAVYVVGETAPSLKRMGYIGDRIVAMNNGKSMVLALSDFAAEYGSFPDRETAKAVRRNTLTTLDLDGDSANAYFRQMIAAGIAKSEDPFFSVTPYSLKKPDNNMRGAEALRHGEVGFGYLMDGNKAMPAGDPNRIIAVTPLLDATATGEFDPEPLDGKAALVFLDFSVKLVPISKDKKVRVRGSQRLLDVGAGTLWGDTTHPVIKPPLTPPQWKPGQSMPHPQHKQGWSWLVVLIGGGLALALIAMWAMWRKDG